MRFETSSNANVKRDRRAAGLILLTPAGQVLVGERALDLPLFGGFTAFPGGMLQAEDIEVAAALFGESSDGAIIRAAALRELFEEAGVYLDGQRLIAAPPELRTRPFLEMHRVMGRPRPARHNVDGAEQTYDLGGLIEAGRWHTPEFAPSSIDAHFFCAIVVEAPTALTPSPCSTLAPSPAPASDHGLGRSPDPGRDPARAEMTNLRFEDPTRVLEARERFEVTLALPTQMQLQALASATTHTTHTTHTTYTTHTTHTTRARPAPYRAPVHDIHDIHVIARQLRALVGARGETVTHLEVLPNIVVVPLKTPTLPPATHTNTYLLGGERWIIVDPATYTSEEREKLLEAIDEHAKGRVEAIVLTHHHADHIGSASWLADRLSVPIRAHPITRTLLAGKVPITETLDEGDTLDLGLDARGRHFLLSVLFTPGHAPGHIVLVDEREGARALIAGDMVAGLGSIIIDPPDGNMATYLMQLTRLLALPDKILLPAHGPLVVGSHRKLSAYIEHRNARESLILDALGTGELLKHPVDLLDKAYADTPRFLHPLAARSCLAHLEKLAAEGRVTREGNQFRRTATDPGKA